MRVRRISLLVLCFGASLVASAAAAGGVEEPFFPHAGTSAYDARGYRVRLAYLPHEGGRIKASTTVAAVARRELDRFSLDFFGLRVLRVRVDGRAATFKRRAGKLWIVPAAPIAAGSSFRATVAYAGRPQAITDPDGSQEGWTRTADGAMAPGEPLGTATWIPCNDVPGDKATFAFEITVPQGLKAIANGRLHRVKRRAGHATYYWGEKRPMSPYLALLDIGRGQIHKSRIGKLPAWTLVDPRLARKALPVLAKLPQVIRFESRIFGAYPFEAAGSAVDYEPQWDYALETQSRPIYTFVDLATVVHETAHQWFGDEVGLKRWPDIWLNEGFATWAEWFYEERHGGFSAAQTLRQACRLLPSEPEWWRPPAGNPRSPKNLFAPSVYVRGGMTLQALRQRIGTEPMLRLLRAWVADHRYGSADTAEFVALAEQISGQDLESFFRHWLYRSSRPC
ncbi:MAG: M1 family metallopeptidase [Solirubrobacterales bacterium]